MQSIAKAPTDADVSTSSDLGKQHVYIIIDAPPLVQVIQGFLPQAMSQEVAYPLRSLRVCPTSRLVLLTHKKLIDQRRKGCCDLDRNNGNAVASIGVNDNESTSSHQPCIVPMLSRKNRTLYSW
eukprot:scaffold682_cov363-Pavlova_lutheri.AAC.34